MDIPDKFKNTLENEIFRNCISCDKDLIESNEEYLIEKAIKRFPELDTEEVVFEYAMCIECAERMRSTLSVESRQRVDSYFENRRGNIMSNLFQDYIKEDHSNWGEECMISGENFKNLREYQIYAHCKGDQIVPQQGVFMISGAILEELSELLSEATRDELDRFIDDNFGLPPEFADLIKSREPVFF